MGSITLADRSAGQVILASFFNDIKSILSGDFMGRDVTGAPVSGNNLGTAVFPWGNVYCDELIVDGVAFNNAQLERPEYQIISGAMRAGSNQAAFILAAGSSPNFSVLASSVNLVLSIGGVSVTWVTDKSAIPVTTAAASANTAVVNDGTASGQAATRTWGEYGSSSAGGASPYYPITIGSVGGNISSKVGTYQAFKVGTEYFLAFVESSTSLSRCFRGFFFNSSLAPVKRAAFSNGATITLMNLGWVFVDQDGSTVDTIFTSANSSPTFSYSAPSSPVAGDYWYDQSNNVWKNWSGSAWVIVNRILVGMVVADSTNCVAARSFDFFGLCRHDNTIETSVLSNTVLNSVSLFERINVNGKIINFSTSRAVWDTASNLAASSDRYNASVQATTTEFFYITDQGETKISDIEPYWRPDLLGYYHPYNPWRSVASDITDGSAHFAGGPNLTQFNEIPQYSISSDKIGDAQLGTRHYSMGSVTADKIESSPNFTTSFGSRSARQIFGNVNGHNMGNDVTKTIAQSYGGDSGAGYRVIAGHVDSGGSVTEGEGFTATKNSTGNYTVTFLVGASSGNFLASASALGGATAGAAISSTGSNNMVVITNTSGSLADHDFMFVALVRVT